MRVRKIRPGLVLVHRWFGLIAAIWLILLSVTGSLIVFTHEFEALAAKDIVRVAPRPGLNIDLAVASAEKAFPDRYVFRAYPPQESGHSLLMWMTARPGRDAPKSLLVHADPVDGRVIGVRRYDEVGFDGHRFMGFMLWIHRGLMWPPLVWFLGLLSFAWALDHLVAAYLSFPVASKWRQSFGIRRGAKGHKFNFDLHRAVGVWLLPITLVVALTGAAANWSTYFRALTRWVGVASIDSIKTEPPAKPLFNPAVGYDRALAIASGRTGLATSRLQYSPKTAAYGVDQYPVGDHRGVLITNLSIDGRTGQILSIKTPNDERAGDTMNVWVMPLHTGEVFGWPGRIAIFLSGIATVALSVTGLLIWSKKRTARRK